MHAHSQVYSLNRFSYILEAVPVELFYLPELLQVVEQSGGYVYSGTGACCAAGVEAPGLALA